MNRHLTEKVDRTIGRMRDLWSKLEDKYRFVAFSTGKDSLALAAMLYEAVEPEKPPCLYVHHELEFPINLEYLEQLEGRGFSVQTLRPFLEYFELTDRGIGFLTLADAWCIPMLIGTGLLEWLRQQGATSPRAAVMFRGMSGSEYSRKWHSEIELYRRLDILCINPLLGFTKDEILEILQSRYKLPLNPIYEHMDRTYCICCHTSDSQRQAYSAEHFPEVCEQYYGHVEKLLFESGLINEGKVEPRYKTREEKLDRHGFVYWRRLKAQDVVGAIKRRFPSGALTYGIRDSGWIETKHLRPVDGRWTRAGNEIRFWNVQESVADVLIKRMINCLDCGFCMVECFPCRRFDRTTKTLQIDGCIQCGKCLRLKFCMGWRHRFWRRIIVEEKTVEK